jgi:FkbM family methyltransferase
MTLAGFKNRLVRIARVAAGTLPPPPPQPPEYNSYSQAGEDRILTFLFQSVRIDRPCYLDIGANHPDVGSNTYHFYLRGSTGVCVEPDPILFEKLRKARPDDRCLNVAVGYDESREMDYFRFDEPSVNTLSENAARERMQGAEFAFLGVTKVPVMRLEEIIESYKPAFPDFVSLDVEGVDERILETFDFAKYPVPIWVVETIDYSPTALKVKNVGIIELMKAHGFFVYADTYINTVFVNSTWYLKRCNA